MSRDRFLCLMVVGILGGSMLFGILKSAVNDSPAKASPAPANHKKDKSPKGRGPTISAREVVAELLPPRPAIKKHNPAGKRNCAWGQLAMCFYRVYD